MGAPPAQFWKSCVEWDYCRFCDGTPGDPGQISFQTARTALSCPAGSWPGPLRLTTRSFPAQLSDAPTTAPSELQGGALSSLPAAQSCLPPADAAVSSRGEVASAQCHWISLHSGPERPGSWLSSLPGPNNKWSVCPAPQVSRDLLDLGSAGKTHLFPFFLLLYS